MKPLLSLFLALAAVCCQASVAIGFNTPATMYGLMGWWPCNQGSGTNIIDRSGLTNDGHFVAVNHTFSQSPLWTNGILSYCLILRAASVQDYIVCTNAGKMLTNDFTVAFWAYPLHDSASSPIYVCDGTASVNGWNVQCAGSYKVQGYTSQSGVNQITLTGNNAAPQNKWVHLCFVRHTTTMTIYTNGVNATVTPASHLDPTAPTGEFRIGDYYSVAAFYFGGLNDVRIYNRVLTTNEIGHLYTQFQ